MKNFSLISVLIIILSSCGGMKNQKLTVVSPGSNTEVTFNLNDRGQPFYSVVYDSKVVIDTSYLGFDLIRGGSLKEGFEVISSKQSGYDTTWEQPWGEEQFVRNHYNELRVSLQESEGLNRKLDIVFRVYDYGIGFRYEFPEQANLSEFAIKNELTEFNMNDDYSAWWIPAFVNNRYEHLYKNTPLTKMGKVHTPVTFRTSDNQYLSIHEAALDNYSSMTIDATSGKRLKCELYPYEKDSEVKVYVQTPSKTPWRTVQMAETPGDLITSYLILNLNEPNKLGDVSWVKPGKYIGIWWEMHVDKGTWGSGEKHSANTENTKKYIDFAAKNGFNGVLVEGWNTGWDGNWIENGAVFSFTQWYPDFDLPELSNYAKERNVYIVGHNETSGNVNNYENQLEAAYQQMEKFGIKAVKTGYVEDSGFLSNGKSHFGQFYVNHFRHVIETAAKHKVAVIAHEPIKDTGERRTYPNMLSREGARGQEYNAWSVDGGNPPNHQTILPFTRFLSGPMDFTPGVFDITIPTKPNNQVNTTLAKQLALYVTIYSPMQMACDLPENYEKYPDAFEFIKEVGVDWETTKVLDAEIGQKITVARKEKGTGNWFIGAITNENPRDISVQLDFLDEGVTYLAKIYKDGSNADYKTNPEAYQILKREVKKGDEIKAHLASSGGMAVSLFKK